MTHIYLSFTFVCNTLFLQVTECEIFLSLIVKFLDPDKPTWQRSLALEVLHKMTIQPELLNSFCECYDLKKHTTSIFQDIVNSLGAYVQSLFITPLLQMTNTSNYNATLFLNRNFHLCLFLVPITQGGPPVFLGSLPAGAGVTPQPGFMLRGIWLPIVSFFPTGQAKSI